MTAPIRPHDLAGVVSTFGDPRPFVNDKVRWERQVLVTLPLPRPLIYAYDTTQLITRVRAHRLVAQHLVDTLEACLDVGVLLDELRYGGCYQWRAMKSSPRKLSLHTWAIAVDLSPAENPLGETWTDDGPGGNLDPRILETFARFGWKWGGEFGRPDPMHFQFATGT